jgi:hypothetical protein
MANTSRPIPEDRFRRCVVVEIPYHLIICTKQLKKVHPGKAVDLSNCLTYLRTLLLPITTGDTKIQQG